VETESGIAVSRVGAVPVEDLVAPAPLGAVPAVARGAAVHAAHPAWAAPGAVPGAGAAGGDAK
jgi:hypothetical protein